MTLLQLSHEPGSTGDNLCERSHDFSKNLSFPSITQYRPCGGVSHGLGCPHEASPRPADRPLAVPRLFPRSCCMACHWAWNGTKAADDSRCIAASLSSDQLQDWALSVRRPQDSIKGPIAAEVGFIIIRAFFPLSAFELAFFNHFFFFPRPLRLQRCNSRLPPSSPLSSPSSLLRRRLRLLARSHRSRRFRWSSPARRLLVCTSLSMTSYSFISFLTRSY